MISPGSTAILTARVAPFTLTPTTLTMTRPSVAVVLGSMAILAGGAATLTTSLTGIVIGGRMWTPTVERIEIAMV